MVKIGCDIQTCSYCNEKPVYFVFHDVFVIRIRFLCKEHAKRYKNKELKI